MITTDFSKQTIRKLTRLGITISLGPAVPGFDGDKYFTGRSYQLVMNDTGYLRSYMDVLAIADGSQVLEVIE